MSLIDRSLDLFDRHKYGIIGTLLLHTLLLLVLNISILQRTAVAPREEPLLMEFTDDEPLPEEQEHLPQQDVVGSQQVTNLASNITASPTMSRAAQERMAQHIESDLKSMEQAEFDRLADKRKADGKEIDMPELDPSKFDKRNYMDQKPKPVKVEGLTTVSYDLKDRTDIVLEVPAYLCKGGGKVVVHVAVDRTGTVLKAELDREASTTSSECMRVHALASANGARFSSAANAPQPQRGTITYLFLAQ